MSRSLSSLAQQSLFASETSDAFLVLLTLSHPDLPQPITVTSDAVPTVSNGTTFVPFPFDLALPNDLDAKSYRARLVIDNIDRQIVQAVRSVSTAPDMLIQIVRAAAPDTVEAQFIDFKLTNVVYDAYRIEGDLTVEDFTAEPYPAATFSPGLFPGLF
ncbi:MAG: DUF1833 family protein [Alphaproteobacteria bacterium]|nr:DUF1833 domain-containing protein [Alphaproteobacteria bacterium]MDE2337564.1 DUF1833 family protein [Alphaproteobacteria bacterium]